MVKIQLKLKLKLKLMLKLKISPKFSGLLRYARRDDFSRHCEERSDVAIAVTLDCHGLRPRSDGCMSLRLPRFCHCEAVGRGNPWTASQ